MLCQHDIFPSQYPWPGCIFVQIMRQWVQLMVVVMNIQWVHWGVERKHCMTHQLLSSVLQELSFVSLSVLSCCDSDAHTRHTWRPAAPLSPILEPTPHPRLCTWTTDVWSWRDLVFLWDCSEWGVYHWHWILRAEECWMVQNPLFWLSSQAGEWLTELVDLLGIDLHRLIHQQLIQTKITVMKAVPFMQDWFQ